MLRILDGYAKISNVKIIIWNRKGRDKVQALKKEAEYTVEDIYALPDGERAELIDGQIHGL